MNPAEIAVMQARLTTLEFVNHNLTIEKEKLRVALDCLLDTIPAETKFMYYPTIEMAYAALNRIN